MIEEEKIPFKELEDQPEIKLLTDEELKERENPDNYSIQKTAMTMSNEEFIQRLPISNEQKKLMLEELKINNLI